MKCLFLFISLISASSKWQLPEDQDLYDEIFHRATGGSAEEKQVFDSVINHFLKDFPLDSYTSFLETFTHGLEKVSKAKYLVPNSPQCEKSNGKLVHQGTKIKGKKEFPGGIVNRVFGFDVGKFAYEQLEKLGVPSGASSLPVQMLSSMAITQAVGMIQTIISDALIIIPPMIPPPFWINQPLPCLPMLTGHTCFGAVLYPITLADFVIADVTDNSVSGYVANFPKLYYSKVGTNEEMYKPCFAAYMSMHCASIFPMCTSIFSRDEEVPGLGRVPMCFHHCILTLVMCPGFWIDDIIGACSDISIPPMCATSTFWRVDLAPPQYVSQEDSQEKPLNCPKRHHDQFERSPFGGKPVLTSLEASPKIAPSRVKSFLSRRKVKKHH